MMHYLTYLNSGGNPFNVTGWGKCQDGKVAAQAETGEAAHEITAAQYETLERTNRPSAIQKGQYRFTYNTTTQAIASKTLTTQSDRQKALAINKARQLRAEYERYLHPDAKVTTGTRTAVADYLNALDDYITTANWAAAWPALPTITASSERLLTRIEDAYTRADDPLARANTKSTTMATKLLRLTDFSNLIENPSFLLGTESWTGFGTGIVVNTTAGRTGGNCLAVSITGGASAAVGNDFVFSVEKDDRIFASVWVKKDAAGAVNTNVGIRLRYYDYQMNSLPVQTVGFIGNSSLTTSYQRAAGIVTVTDASARYAKAELFVYGQTAGTIYFDDAVCAKARAQDLIPDGELQGVKLTGELGTGVRLGGQTPADVGAWAENPLARANLLGTTALDIARLAQSGALGANLTIGADATPLYTVRDRANDPAARINSHTTLLNWVKMATSGAIPNAVTLGGQAASNVGAWAENPIERANSKSTRLKYDRLPSTDLSNMVGNDWSGGTLDGWTVLGQQSFWNDTTAADWAGWRLVSNERNQATLTDFRTVTPGETYFFGVWNYNAATERANLMVEMQPPGGGSSLWTTIAFTDAKNAWNYLGGFYTIPAGYTRARVLLQVAKVAASGGNNTSWTKPVWRRAASTDMIPAGAVVNDKVLAGTLLSDRLSDTDFRNWAWNRANAVGLPAEAAGLPIGGLAEDTNLADGSKVNWDFCGVQRMRHTVTLTYVNGSTLAGSWSFIWHFAEAPHIQVTPRDRSFTPTWNQIAVIRPSARSVSSCTITAYRQTGQTDFVSGDTMTVDVEAIGRWTNTFS